MNPIRKKCRQIMDRICVQASGLHLSDLSDLPCVANALDEMEGLVEAEGEEFVSMSELQNIAQDAVFELLGEENFPLD